MENSDAGEIIFQVNNEFIRTKMNSQLPERERENIRKFSLERIVQLLVFDSHLVLFLVLLSENDFTLRKIDTHKISN